MHNNPTTKRRVYLLKSYVTMRKLTAANLEPSICIYEVGIKVMLTHPSLPSCYLHLNFKLGQLFIFHFSFSRSIFEHGYYDSGVLCLPFAPILCCWRKLLQNYNKPKAQTHFERERSFFFKLCCLMIYTKNLIGLRREYILNNERVLSYECRAHKVSLS